MGGSSTTSGATACSRSRCATARRSPPLPHDPWRPSASTSSGFHRRAERPHRGRARDRPRQAAADDRPELAAAPEREVIGCRGRRPPDRLDPFALPDHRRDRRGRDGRGLPGHRHEARARGGDQGAARGRRVRPRAAGPLRAGGQAARRAQPPQHRPRLRLRDAPRSPTGRPCTSWPWSSSRETTSRSG